MIELSVPGRGELRLEHLVTDVNGTLAVDGRLIDGVAGRIQALRERIQVHMLTADTHGRQAEIDRALDLTGIRIKAGGETEQKAAYVRSLGAGAVVAIGQGANDSAMLEAAALGICVMSVEGAALPTLLASDVCVPDILSALDLLAKPVRIAATLRQ